MYRWTRLPCVVAVLGLLVVACGAPAQPAGPTAAPAEVASPVSKPSQAAPPPATPTAPAQLTSTPVPAATAPATPTLALPAQTPVASVTAGTGATPAPPYARITTSAGRAVHVRLEIADSPQSRAVGLSKRESLASDAGMLFVFQSDGQAPFWMKDTYIPLSIAFISADGTVVDVQDMQPLSEALHQPARPYRYALEVNQGYFRNNGVSAGDRAEFELGGR